MSLHMEAILGDDARRAALADALNCENVITGVKKTGIQANAQRIVGVRFEAAAFPYLLTMFIENRHPIIPVT